MLSKSIEVLRKSKRSEISRRTLSRPPSVSSCLSGPLHTIKRRAGMSDTPSIQPLVSTSSSSSTSPPKTDLPALRQQSLQQAQEELSNRTQSPTSNGSNRFDLIKGRRNAVDASSSQSTTTAVDQPSKPPVPTLTTPVAVEGANPTEQGNPELAAANNAPPKLRGQSLQYFCLFAIVLNSVPRVKLSQLRHISSKSSNNSLQ